MLSVLCYPKSVAVRRCIYKTYVAYCIVLLIVFIVVIILILAVDDFTEDNSRRLRSRSYGSYSSSNYSGDVQDGVKAVYIIILVIWALIYVPITLIGLQCTYWGWKQLE